MWSRPAVLFASGPGFRWDPHRDPRHRRDISPAYNESPGFTIIINERGPGEDAGGLQEEGQGVRLLHAEGTRAPTQELEVANLRGALKHAASMLEELKTSALSPKYYYALWMIIFAEMRELEKNFKEEAKRGRKMRELYASVQQSPSLISRLYLLITVGSVYIQSHEEGFQNILTDIIEMMRVLVA